MSTLTEQEIHALIESAVAEKTADLPKKVKKRFPIYNAVTGDPPPTADGLVWAVDVDGWCDESRPLSKDAKKGRYVRNQSEVVPPEPVKRRPGRPRKKSLEKPADAA